MQPLLNRVHEWFAAKIDWVQYPKVTFLPAATHRFFKNDMHWSMRGLLLLFGAIAILIGAIALFFAGVVLWAIMTT